MSAATTARGRWWRSGSPHLALWLAMAFIAPLGLWAYRNSALELDVASLLSFCSN